MDGHTCRLRLLHHQREWHRHHIDTDQGVSLRITVEGSVVVLFHGFQKKSQKTPLKEIRRAEAIKKEYFKEKENKK